MGEIRVESWCGYDIRFIEHDGEWWAILKDICDALHLRTAKVSERLDPNMLMRVRVDASNVLSRDHRSRGENKNPLDANCEYLKMNNDGSAFCDEKDCNPDTSVKHSVYGNILRKEKMMEPTFKEIIDILNKWQFILGQRAGRELWIDKPSAVQEEDLANFNRDSEKVRSFLFEHSENSYGEDICTCNKCKFLTVLNDSEIYAVCNKTGYIFEQFETDTREHFCAFGERKEQT